MDFAEAVSRGMDGNHDSGGKQLPVLSRHLRRTFPGGADNENNFKVGAGRPTSSEGFVPWRKRELGTNDGEQRFPVNDREPRTELRNHNWQLATGSRQPATAFPYQSGLPSLSRKRNSSLPRLIFLAKMVSLSWNFTLTPVTSSTY